MSAMFSNQPTGSLFGIPYERIVQWLAGPLSGLVGLGATAIVHSSISKATALTVATFVLSSGATLLGHWKWLSNLSKWWDTQSAGNEIPTAASDPTLAVTDSETDLNQGPDLNDGPQRTRTPVTEVPKS